MPSAVRDPAASHDPLLSYPVKENAYCPFSFELLLATRDTVAEAEELVIACEVAFTTTVAGLGRLAGAVYTPAVLTVPQLLPEHPEPLTDHVTALLVVPVTLTMNACCVPTATIALVGEMETTTGAMIITGADTETFWSAMDVAVTTTCVGNESGAV